MSDLEALRTEISELDRRLLELLNRRLELVAAVRDHKDEAGERWIDPEREAELLQALVATNPGPLSERGVRSVFAAVLDVLKEEVAAARRAPAQPAAAAERPRAVERLAVVGTGLMGTSVALAAGRTPPAHPEGYLEAFANIYKNFANAVRARIEKRKLAKDDPANDYPKIEDGVRGMSFIEAVVASSKKNAAWTKLEA